MPNSTQRASRIGSQFSWIAVLAPILSVASAIALVTIVPLDLADRKEIESSEFGYTIQYSTGFIFTAVSLLPPLFLVAGMLAAIIAISLKSGRNTASIIRVVIGILLVCAIVTHLVVNQVIKF